jgi:hypothetical protein
VQIKVRTIQKRFMQGSNFNNQIPRKNQFSRLKFLHASSKFAP